MLGFLDKKFLNGIGSIYNNYDEIEKLSLKKRTNGKMADNVLFFSDFNDLFESISLMLSLFPHQIIWLQKFTIIALNKGCHVFAKNHLVELSKTLKM